MLAELILAAPMIVTDVTPDLVKRAIADTKSAGCYTVGGSFMLSQAPWGCYTTPYSRIVQAAKAAQSAYKPFSESDVTAGLVAPGEIHVYAFAQTVKGSPTVDDVQAIVIVPKGGGRESAIQPVRSEEVPAEFVNLMGASLQGKSMTAVFPMSVLNEQNEIRVVYRGTSGHYEVKARFKLDKVR